MKVFIYLIIIRLICSQQVLYKDLRGFQNTQFTNVKILENSLDSRSSVRSLLACSAFCLDNSRCLSCAFNDMTELCVLWDKDFIDVSKTYVVSEDGWTYYYVIKDCDILEESCLSTDGMTYEHDICGCYKYVGIPLSYDDAVIECASMNGELAKIDRGIIQLKMEHLIDYLSNSSSPLTWISGSLDNTVGEITRIQGKLDSPDIWRYNDGTYLQYFNWNIQGNQPNGKVGEIVLAIRKSYGYLWHDTFPDMRYSVMCQRK